MFIIQYEYTISCNIPCNNVVYPICIHTLCGTVYVVVIHNINDNYLILLANFRSELGLSMSKTINRERSGKVLFSESKILCHLSPNRLSVKSKDQL